MGSVGRIIHVLGLKLDVSPRTAGDTFVDEVPPSPGEDSHPHATTERSRASGANSGSGQL